MKTKEIKDVVKKETFISWYAKNKKNLQEEFPDLSPADLTKYALAKYKEKNESSQNNILTSLESKKRKLSPESEESNKSKRTSNKILSSFAFEK